MALADRDLGEPREGATAAPQRARGRARRFAGAMVQRRRASRSYSHFVGFMKWLLPMAAMVVVILVAIWPELTSEKFRPINNNLDPARVAQLAMLNPKFEGLDSRGQPYRLQSEAATQSPSGDDFIELDRPAADVQQRDGSTMAIMSDTGLFDRRTELLDLYGTVIIVHDAGHEFRTASGRIDLKAGRAWGEAPVVGQSPLGTITAQGFRIERRGSVVYFYGRSRLVLYQDEVPRRARPAVQTAAPPASAGSPAADRRRP